MRNDVFHILGNLVIEEDNSKTLRLYSNPSNNWTYEDITANIDVSCDIEFSNTGNHNALFTQNRQLKLATKL